MKKIIFLALFLPIASNIYAQALPTNRPLTKKNRFFLYWGYNRSAYTKSDMRFTGENYDFTLENVKANDRPTPFGWEYFFPQNISIPQNNWRIGYFLNQKYSISIAMDHMKYVMLRPQTVRISGLIENTNTEYDKVYDNEEISLERPFLAYEHTDGLNYLNIALRRSDTFFNRKNLKVNNFEVSLITGLETGIVVPRSDIDLLDYGRRDKYQLAGYGISGVAGVNFLFWRHFFIQAEYKGGFIGLPNVQPTNIDNHRVKQNFGFAQWNLSVGSNFAF